MSSPAIPPATALSSSITGQFGVDLIPTVHRVADHFPELPWLAVLDAVEEQARRFSEPWLLAFVAPAAVDRLRRGLPLAA